MSVRGEPLSAIDSHKHGTPTIDPINPSDGCCGKRSHPYQGRQGRSATGKAPASPPTRHQRHPHLNLPGKRNRIKSGRNRTQRKPPRLNQQASQYPSAGAPEFPPIYKKEKKINPPLTCACSHTHTPKKNKKKGFFSGKNKNKK